MRRNHIIIGILGALGILVWLPASATAQTPVTQGAQVSETFTLQGVKVGDQVEITYTQAWAISVAPAGK